MWKTIGCILGSCLALASCGSAGQMVAPEQSSRSAAMGNLSPATLLADAAEWLWNQQAKDGGWHSQQYAFLRSGEAMTPVVLSALWEVPETVYPKPPKAMERALKFIRLHVNELGMIGLSDPEIPEYPNYATAYALSCLVRAENPADMQLITRMANYLATEQYRTENGFPMDHLAYGGWGFGGYYPEGSTGHMDIAHTRRALAALQLAGQTDKQVFRRAEIFLRLVQKRPEETRFQPAKQIPQELTNRPVPYDGGFYFSPIVHDANKGRETRLAGRPYFASYASATCDGVLALLDCGVPANDQRVVDGVAWLKDHPRLDYPEGIPEQHPEPWGDSIRFYHLAVRAEVYSALDWPGGWRKALGRELADHQRGDGSFQNRDSHLMKEDDPLMCSALAVTALAKTVK